MGLSERLRGFEAMAARELPLKEISHSCVNAAEGTPRRMTEVEGAGSWSIERERERENHSMCFSDIKSS